MLTATRLACLTAAFAMVLWLCLPATANAQQNKTHLLAVSICPPYRAPIIPVDVCANGIKLLVPKLQKSLGIAPADTTVLLNEEATGTEFLQAMEDLAGKLGENDRLIFYLTLHGATRQAWARYLGDEGLEKSINTRDGLDDYVLVFWTKEKPGSVALALAENSWLTVGQVLEALERLPAKTAMVVDSCESGRTFEGFHKNLKTHNNIDFFLASAGVRQASNFDASVAAPLLTRALSDALDVPTVTTFGEAVAQARAATVFHAAALCDTMTIKSSVYPLEFPNLAVPNQQTADGEVLMPAWYCTQVPTVADFSGEMSNWRLKRPAR